MSCVKCGAEMEGWSSLQSQCVRESCGMILERDNEDNVWLIYPEHDSWEYAPSGWLMTGDKEAV